MPPTYIVDASVAVKWLNQKNEPAAAEALALLQEAITGACLLVSSDLLPHEVLNALIRGKGLNGRPLEQAVELFFSFPLEYVPTSFGLAAAAALIAEQERLTFYDAIYVALAFERSAPLITANPAHQGKFKKIRVIDIADRQNPLLPSSFNG